MDKSLWPQADDTQQLLAKAGAGSSDAVNQLLERHRAAVHRLVQIRLDQKVQRRLDVSDVVQDVMIEASTRLQNYLHNPEMAFHLWLRQIAWDHMIDAYRKHRVSAKRSIDREQPMQTGSPDQSSVMLAAQLFDPQITPAAHAMRQEIVGQVETAIAVLNDQDREIVHLRHYEYLSNLEIAEVLSITPAAASMRYLRAVRRLRELLDETGDGSGKSAEIAS